MATLDTSKVWAAMMSDPDFLSTFDKDEDRQVMRETVELLPGVLVDHLDKPLTLAALMEAQMAFMRASMEGELLAKMVRLQVSQLPSSEREAAFVRNVGRILQQREEEMASLRVHAFAAGSEDDGQTLQWLFGLNEAAMAAWRAGGLTVAGLLEIQPVVVMF